MCGCTNTSGVRTVLGHVDALAVLGLLSSQRSGELRVGAGAVGAGVCEARILMAAHVIPGPAEEAAFRARW